MTDNSPKGLRRSIAALEAEFHEFLRDAPWKQQTGQDPQQATHNEDDSGGRKPTLLLQVPPAPADSKQAQNPWYKTLKGWNLVLQMIGIPFAIGYAVVTWHQWRDLQHNFAVDQRAWVKFEVETSPLHMADGEGLRIPVRFVNTGKTSALNIRSRIVVQILRSDREMPVPDPQQQLAFPDMPTARNSYQVTDAGVNHIDSGITFPNDSSQALVYLIGKSTKGEPVPEVLTEPEIAAMEHNLSYIAIWGQAWYEDIFGNTHWTKFCTSMAPAGPQTRSPKCAHFNDVDR